MGQYTFMVVKQNQPVVRRQTHGVSDFKTSILLNTKYFRQQFLDIGPDQVLVPR